VKFEDIKKLHLKKFREEYGCFLLEGDIWCKSCRRRPPSMRACAQVKSISHGSMNTGRAHCQFTWSIHVT